MSVHEWDLANRYRGWVAQDIGFSIQWVTGNYSDAEESFLRINTSGTNLSEWEIKLVRYRQSSFARLATSIAHPEFAQRCWPHKNERGEVLSLEEQEQAQAILTQTTQISQLLWEPRNSQSGQRLRPFLMASSSEPESLPFYTGEFLTIVRGQQGQPTQTEEMMRQDRSGSSITILNNGKSLAQDAVDALNHLRGKTVHSMGVVSAAYFYNPEGVSVRSLFYGFLYWISYGTKDEVRTRKQIFCAFRRSFEAALQQRKKDTVTRISRRIGSGGEVTLPTARYFNGLLELVVEHQGVVNTPFFEEAHAQFIEKLRRGDNKSISSTEDGNDGSAAASTTGRNVIVARVASKSQRSRLQLESELKTMSRCEICGGLLLLDDPHSQVQFDHEKQHSEGGKTSDDNLRPTHPFCNHRRQWIEQLKGTTPQLPPFVDSHGQSQANQLTFLTLWKNSEEGVDEDDTPDSAEGDESGLSAQDDAESADEDSK
jgi:hypothetical protein